LMGGARSNFKGGQHRQYEKHTPMANLLLTMLEMAGIEQESIGDSTGKLEI